MAWRIETVKFAADVLTALSKGYSNCYITPSTDISCAAYVESRKEFSDITATLEPLGYAIFVVDDTIPMKIVIQK